MAVGHDLQPASLLDLVERHGVTTFTATPTLTATGTETETATATPTDTAPPTPTPTDTPALVPLIKLQCMNGGWRIFTVPQSFRNQGECIRFVNTGR